MTEQIFEAADSGNIPMLKSLLEGGAQCDVRDAEGETPLMRASKKGNAEAVRLLLEAGASVDLEDARGWTALFMGCHDPDLDRGYPEVVSELVAAGADIEKTIGYGMRPLMIAAGYGEAAVAEVLLKAGAQVRAKNEGGRTALQMATDKNYIDVINLLWEAEMASGEVGSCGSTPSSAAKVVTFTRRPS